MNCKYYRTRTKKYKKIGYCIKYKKEVSLFCKECDNIEYKEYKPIKKRTYKQNKSEKNRFSILQQDTSKCLICSSNYNLTWHEIFAGSNRHNSIKYGLCLRLCLNCHRSYQEDKIFNDYWHIKGQIAFEEHYPTIKFVEIFKKNYKN